MDIAITNFDLFSLHTKESLPIIFDIVQNAFDPCPLPFDHLVENLKILGGHLLGYYEFCSSF